MTKGCHQPCHLHAEPPLCMYIYISLICIHQPCGQPVPVPDCLCCTELPYIQPKSPLSQSELISPLSYHGMISKFPSNLSHPMINLSPKGKGKQTFLGSHVPKGFVHRSEPADVAAGAEEDQPEDGQAKVDTIATSNPPRQAGNDVHDQRDAVNCKESAGKSMNWCHFTSQLNQTPGMITGRVCAMWETCTHPKGEQLSAVSSGAAAQGQPPAGDALSWGMRIPSGAAKGWRTAQGSAQCCDEQRLNPCW